MPGMSDGIFQKGRKRFIKNQVLLGGSAAILIVLLLLLAGVLWHFMRAEQKAENFIRAVQDKKSGGVTMKELAEFGWEKGYCFPPYTSKEEMEKKLGFSSGKLEDNMINDNVQYIVFTKGKRVVCSFFSNREKKLEFDLPAEFTPKSTVYIIEEKAGKKLSVQSGELKADEPGKAEPAKVSEMKLQEGDVYTFLQGPKSWRQRLTWSGEWGESFYDSGSFGGFGCGLCCIANLYSTLTKYRCTPLQAYRYAKKKTDYAGGGAIEWGYLRQTLTSLGFDCGVKKKPSSYQEFQKDIAASNAAIVLVSSDESSCFWKDTPGHYVTIFLYDEEKDKVFLADSGEPKRNRRWISLKKVYKSLKTASTWQYLPIGGYDGKKDEWKHKKADGNWVH